MKKAVKESKSPVFIRLDKPKMLEKEILSSAMIGVNTLKSMDNIVYIRNKKLKKMQELKKLLGSMSKDAVDLKKSFPVVEGVELNSTLREPSNDGELKGIDAELREIEGRLKEL